MNVMWETVFHLKLRRVTGPVRPFKGHRVRSGSGYIYIALTLPEFPPTKCPSNGTGCGKRWPSPATGTGCWVTGWKWPTPTTSLSWSLPSTENNSPTPFHSWVSQPCLFCREGCFISGCWLRARWCSEPSCISHPWYIHTPPNPMRVQLHLPLDLS